MNELTHTRADTDTIQINACADRDTPSFEKLLLIGFQCKDTDHDQLFAMASAFKEEDFDLVIRRSSKLFTLTTQLPDPFHHDQPELSMIEILIDVFERRQKIDHKVTAQTEIQQSISKAREELNKFTPAGKSEQEDK